MPFNPDTGIWDSTYSPPAPHDLPAVRLYLREVFAQPEALAFHTTMVKEGRFSLDLIRSPVLNGQRSSSSTVNANGWPRPPCTGFPRR
jgi:hypothetical protein